MRRLIEDDLKKWKESKYRKPLIVRGARQVGKTYSLQKFGQDFFANTVVLDFDRNPRHKEIFAGELSPEKLVRNIEIAGNARIIPGQTLLILDEIQECPKALLSLRFFHEELPELHVASAGSLLELAVGDISFPVGRVEFLWLRPLGFKEFLWANGQNLLADALPTPGDCRPVTPPMNRQFLDHLRDYYFVGGLPEAVARFVATKSFQEVKAVHINLIETYQQSFHKYSAKIDKDSLLKLLHQIPAQVGKQIKYSRLDPDRRIEKTKASLDILERSLLIHIVRNAPGSRLPLGASASDRVFKMIFLDIGLMQTCCGVQPYYLTEGADLIQTFQGALAEQFVGQELLASGLGSEQGKLYYWQRAAKSSNAEVDYLIVRGNRIIPIEVKNAPSGRLRSLHLFLKENPDSPVGLVLSTAGHETISRDRLRFVPLYADLSVPAPF